MWDLTFRLGFGFGDMSENVKGENEREIRMITELSDPASSNGQSLAYIPHVCHRHLYYLWSLIPEKPDDNMTCQYSIGREF